MNDKSLPIEPLLLRAKQAAAVCGVSERKWSELHSTGSLPPSQKIGGCRVWKTEYLRLWVKWDMPKTDQFMKLLESGVCR